MPSKSSSKKPSKKAAASENAAADTVVQPPPVLQPRPPAPPVTAIPAERSQFKQLLLANPNHFGTLRGSTLKAIKPMGSNTTFEELMCVGFNPQLDQLEAVVYLKQNGGYGGGVCSAGTPEYVRFYLSYDNGATWQDVGLTSFTAYDLPGPLPVEFAVTILVDPRKRICTRPNLPKVRAILSWNDEPTANTPNFMPVWGNVREVNIQVAPFWLFRQLPHLELKSVFEDLKLAPDVLSVIDQSLTAVSAKPPVLNAAQVHASYVGKNVPEHRSLFPFIQKQLRAAPARVAAPQPLLKAPLLPPPPVAPGLAQLALGSQLADLKVDLSKVIAVIQQTDGNTSFEELTCIGLDTNNDWLVGVVTVKLPNGYSGTLCSDGSREYVAFWVDWGDGAGWQHVGTTSVRVHDINNIPAGGLQYAVFQPINTVFRRRPCNQGAVTARVRAILSWENPPPAGNPDWKPTWGNREETRVFIKPGPKVEKGDVKLYLESVGGQPVCNINQTTGYASGERPFGGVITVSGLIPGAPDISSPNPLKYKISVRQLAPVIGPWQTVDNTFGVTVLKSEVGVNGGLPVMSNMTQSVDADGYYTYLEDMDSTGSGWRTVYGRVLAHWITAAPMEGPWEIKAEVKDHLGNVYPAGVVTCEADGTTRQNIKVFLDEVLPDVDVKITGFSRGGGPVQPAVDCATIQVGDVIHGTYKALDDHFGSLTLTVEPAGPAGGAAANPAARSYPVVPTTGENGTWTLNTAPMAPCGYVIRLVVSDRTIVNSGGGSWWDDDYSGFCLAKKQ